MIEPCPFCGSSDENIGRTSESVIRFWVHCRTCYCDGPAKETVEQAIEAHNRLSRIVRAAEEYVKARQNDSGDYAYQGEGGLACGKYELLRMVVEGGAE